jgi:uncharacterized delta-60 repeat protein
MRDSNRGIIAALLLVPLVAWAGEANLDPTFGSFGITTTNVNSGDDAAADVVLQADGKIVAAGFSEQGGKFVFTVIRYATTGAVDASYGTGGTTNIAFGDNAIAQHVVIQSDGKVIVGGVMFGDLGAPDDAIALTRLDTTGALDPTFGTGGKVLTDLTPSYDSADAMALQSDGKLVVGSSSADGSGNAHFNIVRYLPDGSLDATFGSGGHVTTIVGTFDIIGDVLVQPDGKIVAVGESTGPNAVAVRYLANGTLDAGFGTAGIVRTTFSPAMLLANAAVLQPDGAIVIAGNSSDGNFAIARLTPTGSVDGAFASGGIGYADLGANDIPTDMVRRPDGRFVVSGEVVRSPDPDPDIDIGVATWLPNGSPDAAFGTAGRLAFSLGAGVDQSLGIALQADGKIVIAGDTSDAGGADTRFLVARLGSTCGNGVLDPGEQCDDGNAASNDCCSIACQYDAVGASCDVDADACTADTCDGAGTCTAGAPLVCGVCEQCDVALGCVGAPPAPTCKAAAGPAASKLKLKRNTTTRKVAVGWKWKGAATTLAELGDPTTTNDYGFCLYATGAGANLASTAAPAGGTCHGRPCWLAAGTQGFLYRDADLTPDGILKAKVLAGSAGHARATVKGKEVALAFPTFSAISSIGPPIRAQLRARNGLCLEAVYSNLTKSSNEKLSAKSD